MAKSSERTFKSNHDGPITVAVPHAGPISFEPGTKRTHTTSSPWEIAALEANPDIEEVKDSKK